MKMWQCGFCTLLLLICVWLFSYGIIRRENFVNKAAIEVNIVQHNEEVKIIKENDTDTGRNEIIRGKVKHHVPKVMLEFYENSKLKINNRHPDIVRSVVPTQAGSHNLLYSQEDSNYDHHMLIFNVPSSNEDELFIKAELRVFTLIEIKSKLALGIERQIKISLYNETTNKMKFLEEKHIYHTDNTWISFNVSHAVQSIITDTSSNKNKILKFIITIKLFQQYKTNKTGVLKLSLMPIEENFEHDYPVLLLFYASAKSGFNEKQYNDNNNNSNSYNNSGTVINVRNKRYVVEEDYEEESNKIWDEDLVVNKAMSRKMKRFRNNCKRRPLYIDFAEIQYDTWIVQPSGYEAYQCAGKCFYPVAEHLSPTKHAIVQALLHSVAPTRAPRSCCVPTKLDSISVLYVDAQGVLTYRYAYKDMVVTECGCR